MQLDVIIMRCFSILFLCSLTEIPGPMKLLLKQSPPISSFGRLFFLSYFLYHIVFTGLITLEMWEFFV